MPSPQKLTDAVAAASGELLSIAEAIRGLTPTNDLGPDSYDCPLAEHHHAALEDVRGRLFAHAAAVESAAAELVRHAQTLAASL
jgi:hypothetical protein